MRRAMFVVMFLGLSVAGVASQQNGAAEDRSWDRFTSDSSAAGHLTNPSNTAARQSVSDVRKPQQQLTALAVAYPDIFGAGPRGGRGIQTADCFCEEFKRICVGWSKWTGICNRWLDECVKRYCD
jgi:hypothetical protein